MESIYFAIFLFQFNVDRMHWDWEQLFNNQIVRLTYQQKHCWYIKSNKKKTITKKSKIGVFEPGERQKSHTKHTIYFVGK